MKTYFRWFLVNRIRDHVSSESLLYLLPQKWRRRWFQLRGGAMPGQYILQYYVDNNTRRLKGSIDLDQCEQVRQDNHQKLVVIQYQISSFIVRLTLVSHLSVARSGFSSCSPSTHPGESTTWQPRLRTRWAPGWTWCAECVASTTMVRISWSLSVVRRWLRRPVQHLWPHNQPGTCLVPTCTCQSVSLVTSSQCPGAGGPPQCVGAPAPASPRCPAPGEHWPAACVRSHSLLEMTACSCPAVQQLLWETPVFSCHSWLSPQLLQLLLTDLPNLPTWETFS